jgi:DNA-binding NarL/FixJ family response regulator
MAGSSPQDFRPRVLIADDHAIFAESLRDHLQKRFNIVGISLDGRALVRDAIRLEPDIVVVDVGMPLLNGLDAARRVQDEAPGVKFVFLTMQNDANLAAAVLELGAVGFVLKQSGASELLKAIESVLEGKPYLTPRLKTQDWAAAKARARQYYRDLTPRQRDVVQLFAEGRSMKEIADILSVSHKTVEFHKHQVMELFNLSSNADLVLFALQHGLIHVRVPGPAPNA